MKLFDTCEKQTDYASLCKVSIVKEILALGGTNLLNKFKIKTVCVSIA